MRGFSRWRARDDAILNRSAEVARAFRRRPAPLPLPRRHSIKHFRFRAADMTHSAPIASRAYGDILREKNACWRAATRQARPMAPRRFSRRRLSHVRCCARESRAAHHYTLALMTRGQQRPSRTLSPEMPASRFQQYRQRICTRELRAPQISMDAWRRRHDSAAATMMPHACSREGEAPCGGEIISSLGLSQNEKREKRASCRRAAHRPAGLSRYADAFCGFPSGAGSRARHRRCRRIANKCARYRRICRSTTIDFRIAADAPAR